MSREFSNSMISETNENRENNIEKNETLENNSKRQERIDKIEENLDAERNTKEDVRKEIEENSPYSDELNEYISSKEELEVYKQANLHEEVYGDPPKYALVRDDIEMHGICDHKGRDNAERIEQGLSPMTNDGDIVELHHIGQKDDSPLAELTQKEHRGTGNDTVLHDKTKDSEIDRPDFTKERKEYWQERAYVSDVIEEGDY